MDRVQRPGLAELSRARERIGGALPATPLVELHSFGRPADIRLKLETLQPVGSFKIRGVLNALSCMTPERRAPGVSTVSAGNTAQALAYGARLFGVAARCLMPESAPAAKIEAVRAYGGTPVLVPTAEVFRFLQEEAWREEPQAFVHPWIDADVIAGHGVLGLELLEQCPEVETVFVPVGGGGLLAGVGSALRARGSRARIVAVEPEACPALHVALQEGAPRVVPCRTICDGVAVPYVTSELFPLLSELVDDSVLVSEQRVRAAVRRLAVRDKVVAEPSGALAVAAAEDSARDRRGAAVALVTGGSIDPLLLAEILRGEGS